MNVVNQTQFEFSVTLKTAHTLKSGKTAISEKIKCNGVHWSVEVVYMEDKLNFRVICDSYLSCCLKLTFEEVGFYSSRLASMTDAPTTFSFANNKSENFFLFAYSGKESRSTFPLTPSSFSEQGKCKVIVSVSNFVRTTEQLKSADDLTSRLRSFLLDDDTADFYVITDNNERIPAHKLILMASSPVFKAMLTSKMSESVNNEIMISEVSSAVVRLFLSYLYGHQPETFDDNSMTVELLALAHKYEVQGLVIECENQLCESITVSNAIDLLLLSDTYSLPELKTKLFDFITRNIARDDVGGFLERITPDLTFEFLQFMSNIVANIQNSAGNK